MPLADRNGRPDPKGAKKSATASILHNFHSTEGKERSLLAFKFLPTVLILTQRRESLGSVSKLSINIMNIKSQDKWILEKLNKF